MDFVELIKRGLGFGHTLTFYLPGRRFDLSALEERRRPTPTPASPLYDTFPAKGFLDKLSAAG
jgi:hypothetical protein